MAALDVTTGGGSDDNPEKLGLMIGLGICVICTCVLAGIMVYLLTYSEADDFITSYRNDVLHAELATPPPPAINIAFNHNNSTGESAQQDGGPATRSLSTSHFFPGDLESYHR